MRDCKVTVFVPSTVNGNVPDAALALVWKRAAQASLAQLFGGATAIDGEGCWMSNGTLVTEAVVLVSASTDRQTLAANLANVHELAHQIRCAMTQEAVALEVNGVLSILTAADAEVRKVA